MGQSQSVSVLQAGIAAGILFVGYKLVVSLYFSAEERDGTVVFSSPIGRKERKDSFLSTDSAEATELDGEIERAVEFINCIKRLMQEDNDDNQNHPNRKRQLEESLIRAESSFHNLFELKSTLKRFETNGILLESKVTTEVAKSAAMRDIEERLLWSGFGPKAADGGDASPFKRQRTTSTS